MNPLLIGPIFELLKTAFNKVFPDPQAQADAQLKLMQLMQTGELAQMANDTNLALAQINVNNTEAQGTGFKANWRPFVGWVCGVSLAWNYIIRPAVVTAAALYGHPVVLPSADMSELMPVLLGMLGLAGMRTFEKVQGKAA